MSTYRKEWPCCDSVSETQGWEPETCPFCRSTEGEISRARQGEPVDFAADVELGRLLDAHRTAKIDHSVANRSSEHYQARKALIKYLNGKFNAATKASAPADAPKWGRVDTVGDMVRNLLTLDQGAPIFTAFHLSVGGERRCKTSNVAISRERVIDGQWIDSSRKDVPYAHVIWAKPDERAPAEDAREQLPDARRAMFNAYSECLADDNLTVDQIADKLLMAARRAAGSDTGNPTAGSEKAKEGEACAHCSRLPGERRDECEHCPAVAAPAHPGEQQEGKGD